MELPVCENVYDTRHVPPMRYSSTVSDGFRRAEKGVDLPRVSVVVVAEYRAPTSLAV